MLSLILLFVTNLFISSYSCRVLVLSGGGAHGAFQAGVIKKLDSIGTSWDIITGVSVGSLNGIALGLYSPQNQTDAVKLMEDIWMNITSNDVYNWNWDPIYDTSLLDSSPLNKTVYNIISRYNGLAQRDVIFGSTVLNTGLMELFRRNDLNSTLQTTNIIMASSAIPLVFPPIYFNGKYYVDGGTYSNELVRPGIEFCLSRGDTNITIDVIICSPPINYISNEEISKYGIFSLASRAYSIMSNSVFNHQIYSSCNNDKYKIAIPMYIYKPNKPYPGSMLDFDHKDIVTMFEMGYGIEKPNITKYCY